MSNPNEIVLFDKEMKFDEGDIFSASVEHVEGRRKLVLKRIAKAAKICSQCNGSNMNDTCSDGRAYCNNCKDFQKFTIRNISLELES